jgi:hypothetical protein
MNKTLSRFVFLAVCGITAACGAAPDPPRFDACQPTKKAQSVTQTSNSTDNLVVYLDTSASMAGYISPNGKTAFAASPDGSTIFSKTLLELRNIVTTMSPQPRVVVRRVDTNVSAPSYSDLDLSTASVNRNVFNGKETNLAGAIKSFSEPLDKDAEDKSPPRFHILITDGVQSSDKNNVNSNCAQGSDPLCVKRQLLELIGAGWGGAVFGLKSEFQGTVYSEIQRGKAIQYATGKDANKYRPFYLYVFSPDRTALDSLAAALKKSLAPLGRPEAFREYGLTTDYVGAAATVEINQDKATKDLLEVRQEKGKEGDLAHMTVRSSAETEKKGAQQFIVSVKPTWSAQALNAGSADELASLIKWDLKAIVPDKEDAKLRYPNFKLVKQEPKNGGAELTFETGWTAGVGGTAWRMYQAVGTLDVGRPAPPWVSAWTTNLDTTAEVANKTLNIESSLGNLWKNPVLENYPIAEFCVRVGQK